jgi:hypothetical protein
MLRRRKGLNLSTASGLGVARPRSEPGRLFFALIVLGPFGLLGSWPLRLLAPQALAPHFIRDHGLLDSGRHGKRGGACGAGSWRRGERAECRKSVKVGAIRVAGLADPVLDGT